MHKIKLNRLIKIILFINCLYLLTSCENNNDNKSDSGISDQNFDTISPQDAYNLIQKNMNSENFIIIDLRDPDSYKTEHIEKAININYSDLSFESKIEELDRNNIYLIYCSLGKKSNDTLLQMKEMLFREVYGIDGGFEAWKSAGLPTISD